MKNNKTANGKLEDALRYALRLLSYRDRSEEEIASKLSRKGFSEDVVDNVVSYLKEKGFLDDFRIAEALKKSAIERKFLGRIGVKGYLIRRGISDSIIDSVIGKDEDYIEVAVNYISKKLKGNVYIDKDMKERLFRGLLRRGFSFEVINKAFKIYKMEV
jgi:regulatory protein